MKRIILIFIVFSFHAFGQSVSLTGESGTFCTFTWHGSGLTLQGQFSANQGGAFTTNLNPNLTLFGAVGQTIAISTEGLTVIHCAINRSNNIIATADIVIGGNQPQTLSVAPSTSASGAKGQTFVFTLSGAQSSNTYSASVVSGNVSLALSGNSLTVFTSQSSGSTGVISVHINSGNGYDASDSVDITLTLGASKKVRFIIPANKGDYTIIYKAYQGGVEIGSITKVAGAGGSIFEIDVGADGGEVTLKQFASGLGVDGVSLVNQSGTTSQVGTESKQTPSTDPTLSPAAAGDGVVLLNPANNTSKASVWEVPPVNAAPATDSTIRQGFDKLVGTDAQIPTVPDETAAINATDLTTTAETAGDSLSTARTGYNSRLSEIQSTKPVLPTVNSEIHRYEIHCLPDAIGPIVLDFSRFETPISIMRAIIKFAIIFMSWFAYAKTLKSSIV